MPEHHSPRPSRRARKPYSTSSILTDRPGRASKSQQSKWTTILALSALVAAVAFSAYAFYRYFDVRGNIAPPKVERKKIAVALDQTPKKEPDAFTYVLLLGNDTRRPGAWARSDTILLARLSNKDKSVLLLSIPRDTRVPVPGHGMTKINHASAYGGAALEIETVKKFTGLPVNHYVQIDFDGFDTAVDAMGGVDMYVDRRIATPSGWVGPGVAHLNGAAALTVVRNRKYADGDFSRARNQQRFLSAVFKKLAAGRDPGQLARIATLVSDQVETDMTMIQMLDFFKAYKSAANSDIPAYTVPGRATSIDGVSYVLPNEAEARALFEAIKRGETPPAQKAATK